jgi:hypothetical protein
VTSNTQRRNKGSYNGGDYLYEKKNVNKTMNSNMTVNTKRGNPG